MASHRGPIVYGLYLYLQRFEHGFGFLLFLSVIPVMVGLVGLFELIFGIPFEEMETRWNTLKKGQRGLVILLMVALVFVVGSRFISVFFAAL